MLQAQSPRLHIKIPPSFPLQGPWMAGLLTQAAQTLKSGVLLLKLRLQIGARRKTIDQNPKRIALESGVQIVILRGAVIDAEARADHRFSLQCAGSPSQSQARIKVHVTGVVQCRVRRTRRGVDGTGARRYVE